MAKILNENEFNQKLESGEAMLVDFFADWCGPCKMLTPVIEELAQEFEGKKGVYKVNVDSTPELAKKYDVSGIPTILFFKDGEIKNSIVGFSDKNQLTEELNKL
ncbi:MAG: thioredoxin [Candidatus Muiribacteriota bacterium]